MFNENKLEQILERIAVAVEKLSPESDQEPDFTEANAFVWQPKRKKLYPIDIVNALPLDLLNSIKPMKDQLLANTLRFAEGYAANNALLWGARGMGKSSLVKAVHSHINKNLIKSSAPLKLIEIHREDIASLPLCLDYLRAEPFQFIIFCDDLSFEEDDASYKSLKAVLEGGIQGRPSNVIFYATSNRRHLIPRHLNENEPSTEINFNDVINEKVSLSDRFGLWLGFHNCSQADYLQMVKTYANYFKLEINDSFEPRALEWSMTRGSRSGRVAWQFIQDLAGEQKKTLKTN